MNSIWVDALSDSLAQANMENVEDSQYFSCITTSSLVTLPYFVLFDGIVVPHMVKEPKKHVGTSRLHSIVESLSYHSLTRFYHSRLVIVCLFLHTYCASTFSICCFASSITRCYFLVSSLFFLDFSFLLQPSSIICAFLLSSQHFHSS